MVMLIVAGTNSSYEDLRAINKERCIRTNEAVNFKLPKTKSIGSIDNLANSDPLSLEVI